MILLEVSALTAVNKVRAPACFVSVIEELTIKYHNLQAQAIITSHFVDRRQNSVRPLQRGGRCQKQCKGFSAELLSVLQRRPRLAAHTALTLR